MKKFICIVLFAIGISVFNVNSQNINDDILRMLRVSGTDKLADQVMDAMILQFQQLGLGIPNTFWAKFREKVNMDDLLFACVPVYAKYYTRDEIRQLITFYESPLGKRLVEVTPKLTQETMAIGQRWGEQLGQDIVNELIKEGYIKNWQGERKKIAVEFYFKKGYNYYSNGGCLCPLLNRFQI